MNFAFDSARQIVASGSQVFEPLLQLLPGLPQFIEFKPVSVSVEAEADVETVSTSDLMCHPSPESCFESEIDWIHQDSIHNESKHEFESFKDDPFNIWDFKHVFSLSYHKITSCGHLRSFLPSPEFHFASHTWRVKVFPYLKHPFVALYLELVDRFDLKAPLCVEFRMGFQASRSALVELECSFDSNVEDCGSVTEFTLQDLAELADDFQNITIVVFMSLRSSSSKLPHLSVPRILPSLNPRADIGAVGIKNLGATCYMNSYLQSLFHLSEFRKAMYHLPIVTAEKNRTDIGWQLQCLFYALQTSLDAPDTRALTTSFGWSAADAYQQHDIQEFARLLMDRLEERMQANSVTRLFEGAVQTKISCLHVAYESTRVEPFFDLSLDVKGLPDLLASFRHYTSKEQLLGDNRYRAEVHGLQDAQKRAVLAKLPPVLQLQLKRFEYTLTGDMVKIEDRFEYPSELDLTSVFDSPEDARAACVSSNPSSSSSSTPSTVANPYLPPLSASENASCDASLDPLPIYILHSVLVHSGGVMGGHYCAIVRRSPIEAPDAWVLFDDDRVSSVPSQRALEENYGGDRRFESAYMLTYVRRDQVETLLAPVTDADVPPALLVAVTEAATAAQLAREAAAAELLLTNVRVISTADLAAAADPSAPLVTWAQCSAAGRSVRIARAADLTTLMRSLEATLEIAVADQILFIFRRNPSDLVLVSSADYSIPFLGVAPSYVKLCLEFWRQDQPRSWGETEADLTFFVLRRPITPASPTAALMLFKYFDVRSQSVSFVGADFISMHEHLPSLQARYAAWAKCDEALPSVAYECVLESQIGIVGFEQRRCHGDSVFFWERLSDDVVTELALKWESLPSPEPADPAKLPTPRRFWSSWTASRAAVHVNVLLEEREAKLQVGLLTGRFFGDQSVAKIIDAIAAHRHVRSDHVRMFACGNGFYHLDKTFTCTSTCTLASTVASKFVYEVLTHSVDMLLTHVQVHVYWLDQRALTLKAHLPLVARGSTLADVSLHLQRTGALSYLESGPSSPDSTEPWPVSLHVRAWMYLQPYLPLRLMTLESEALGIWPENARVRLEYVPDDEVGLDSTELIVFGGWCGGLRSTDLVPAFFTLSHCADETIGQLRRRLARRMGRSLKLIQSFRFHTETNRDVHDDAFVVDELFKPKRSKLSHAPELVHAPALRLVGISEPAPSPTLFNHTLKIG